MSTSYMERVYARLKRSIIAHDVKPGDIINERGLAEALHVSRTPVRKAIQRLETEGWVAVQPWKGVVVLPVTPDEVDEVLQLRLLLEPMILDMIITRLDQQDITRLEDLLTRQSKLRGPEQGEEFIRIDHEFHITLAEMSGGKRLLQFMSQLRDIQLRLGVTAVQRRDRFAETLAEHEEIICHLRRRDCLGAKHAMVNHLLRTRKALSLQVFPNE